jgi:hypothetical protein
VPTYAVVLIVISVCAVLALGVFGVAFVLRKRKRVERAGGYGHVRLSEHGPEVDVAPALDMADSRQLHPALTTVATYPQEEADGVHPMSRLPRSPHP